MKLLNEDTLPLLLRVATAVEVSGLSRSEIYRRINSGELIARKNRKTTYVESRSLLANVANLPRVRPSGV